MMDRFHLIDEAAAILQSKGVYRQAKVYRRGKALYASHGAGFIRLYLKGTSLANVICEEVEVPGEMEADHYGRLSLK